MIALYSKIKIIFLFLILTTLFESHAFCFSLRDLNLNSLRSEFIITGKKFTGHWLDGRQWRGFFCSGGYQYDVKLRGSVKDLALEQADDGSVKVDAYLTAITANLDGHYLSEYSFCYPLEALLGLSVDSLKTKAIVTVVDPDNSEKVKVKVLSTEFGTIHFGIALSPTIEKFATTLANSAFNVIWKSFLGDWFNERISKIANEVNSKPQNP